MSKVFIVRAFPSIMVVEVEIRSFISKEKYEELLAFFYQTATFVSEDYQETYYFDAKEDIRIQRNNFYSKIWMKKGKIHDEAREEIEIKFNREDFEKLEQIFLAAGLNVQIKWFRNRHTFQWNDINVMLDYTKGYGYIIELEQVTDGEEKENTLDKLRQKLTSLNILLTPKEEFDQKYAHYKEHWRELIQ